jgi:Glutamine synthetase
MAKWNAELPGSSGHIHQSLWRGEQNVLFDEASRKSYIAGLMQYLPELMPMICPTVNSYKRLVPGTWAPVSATWGSTAGPPPYARSPEISTAAALSSVSPAPT